MGAITRAANHLTVEQVKEKLKEAQAARQFQRCLIVYTALMAPRKAAEIAVTLGVSRSLVHKVISLYNRGGAQALKIKDCGGRYHEYLTQEEERAFLAPFFAQAEQGELATTREIHLAYEARLGHEVHETTVYRRLDRHGWRKLMPRPRHPQADPQAQEQFKKTLRRRFNKHCRGESLMIIDQSSSWSKTRHALVEARNQGNVGLLQGSGLAPHNQSFVRRSTLLLPSLRNSAR